MAYFFPREREIVEIQIDHDHEIICYGRSPPLPDSRRVVDSYKRKYVHKVLVNHLIKLTQEKVWLGEHDHKIIC